MPEFVVFLIVVGVLALGLFGYFALMVLFPESVGIQGKIAEQHRKEHEEQSLPK